MNRELIKEAKKPCPECHGEKGFYDTTYTRAGGDWVECAVCLGTGLNTTKKFIKQAVLEALQRARIKIRVKLVGK